MTSSPDQRREGPLSGIRIVDFTANMSGPFATMILGDQGADVIKVEPLNGGDTIRQIGPGVAEMSSYFANLNRSKRSLAIDLTNEASQPIINALLDGADVVVHNFRSSVATRLGLDGQVVRKDRPRLIFVAIGGFGADGPYGGRPAYDHVIQALSGFAARQADPAVGEPSLIRQGVIDKATGLTAAQAICAAIIERSRSGEGQEIEIHMLDVAVSFLWPDGMLNETVLNPVGPQAPDISKSFRLTKTGDGHVSFALVHERQWAKLTAAVGLTEPSVAKAPSRAVVLREVGRKVSQMTTKDTVALFESLDIPIAEVVELSDVATHPQIVANDTLDTVEHPVLGAIRQPNPPIRFAELRAGDMLTAPTLGQHDREILEELGFGQNDIEVFVKSGALGARPAASS